MPQPRWDDPDSRPLDRDVPKYYPGVGDGPGSSPPSRADAPRSRAAGGRAAGGQAVPGREAGGRAAGGQAAGGQAVPGREAGGRAAGGQAVPGREAGGRAARGRAARAAPPQRPGARRWGRLPGRLGVFLVAGGAVAGLLGTLLAGGGPGAVLGVCVVAATAAAVFAVEPAAVYLIIPVPALAYAVAALAAGLLQGRAAGTSTTALAVSAAQWIAGGFLAMTAATGLAVAVTVVRRPRRATRQARGPVA